MILIACCPRVQEVTNIQYTLFEMADDDVVFQGRLGRTREFQCQFMSPSREIESQLTCLRPDNLVRAISVGGNGELVLGVERTSTPDGESGEDIRVGLDVGELCLEATEVKKAT